jgi:O-antigen ligase
VQFGIIGALAYAAGLVALIARIVGYYRRARTSEALGLSCAGLGLLSALFFGTVTAGPPGALLWAIAGLATASRPKAHARAWAAAPARAPVRRSGEPQPVGAVYAREALGGAE